MLRPLGVQPVDNSNMTAQRARSRILLGNKKDEGTAALDDEENMLNISPDDYARSTEETPIGNS